MKYAFGFILFAALLVYIAFARGSAAWVLLWPASSFLIAALAYGGMGPRIMGKRACGTLPPLALIIMLPYLAFSWLLWFVQRPLATCASACEVSPGLWVARRLRPAEVPSEIALVVDLTAEFWAPRALREGRRYVCVPTLDSTCSPEDGFRAALEVVVDAREPVLIHCAQGLGRSAALAAAVLIRRGVASDVADAERRLAASRPGVRLTPAQRDLVRRVTHPLKGSSVLAPVPDV